MQFLCLILRLEEVCTDNNTDADVNNTNDADTDDARRTKHDYMRLFG